MTKQNIIRLLLSLVFILPSISISQEDCESLCLEFTNVDATEGTVDILYSSVGEISGFQFKLTGITVHSVTGDMDMINFNPETGFILGIDLTGTPLPAGEDLILVSIGFNPIAEVQETCITEPIFAGPGASEYEVYLPDCEPIPSCATDCAGVCGGASVEDCLGICDGGAAEDDFGTCCDLANGSVVDDCGVCDGGNGGQDCAGICFGGAEIQTYYWDEDGDGIGDDEITEEFCNADVVDGWVENGGEVCPGGDDTADIDGDGMPDDCDVDLMLLDGNNFISFYVHPDDPAVSSVFEGLEANTNLIFTSGKIAVQNNDGNWIGNLLDMNVKDSWWVKNISPTTLEVQGSPLDPDMTYFLKEGNNMISFPSSGSVPLGDALPDDIEPQIQAIVGAGVAAVYIDGYWVGSLSAFDGGSGYWVVANEDLELQFSCDSFDALNCDGIDPYSYGCTDLYAENYNPDVDFENNSCEYNNPFSNNWNNSQIQMFYIFEEVQIGGMPLEEGDWIGAFRDSDDDGTGDILVGSGPGIVDGYSTIPVMGAGGDSFTDGYMLADEIPVFRIFDASENQVYNAVGEIPPFEPGDGVSAAFVELLNVLEDCAGQFGGSAYEDDCGVCDDDPANDNDAMDECGVCFGNGYDYCDWDDDGINNLEDWGYGAYDINVEDIPDDQGGWVYIQFAKSFYDTDTLRNEEIYTIERLDGESWTSLHSIAAYNQNYYTTEARTLYNGVETTYRVISVMEEGTFGTLEDEYGVGTSEDNIAPAVPENFTTSFYCGTLSMNWSLTDEEDFAYYSIYRKNVDDEEFNLLEYTIDNDYLDGTAELGAEYEYTITASDANGNEGGQHEPVLGKIEHNTFDLHDGYNLISFPYITEDDFIVPVLDLFGTDILGIIGEGVASTQISPGNWIGSLQNIHFTDGYWVDMEGDFYGLSTGCKIDPNIGYELHNGNNLVSYACDQPGIITDVLPDDFEPLILSVIGEGVAATQIAPFTWIGSLSILEPNKGYWFFAEEDFSLTYECNDDLARDDIEKEDEILKPDWIQYNQSTEQAFYFVEELIIDSHPEIDEGWMLAYCSETLVGARQWNGPYTDVPVMGNNGFEETAGYCETGEIPRFELQAAPPETQWRTGSSQQPVVLAGKIPKWEENGIFFISLSATGVEIPTEFVLKPAYPNPFNPVTTIEYGLPEDMDVNIRIYDMNGRLVDELVNTVLPAGYHTTVWNADSHASGLYFISVSAEGIRQTQKLLLLK